MRNLLICGLCLLTGACATLPKLDGGPTAPAAPAPALLPLDQLLARGDTVTITPDTAADLLARAAALRARAARLRRLRPDG